MDFSEGMHQIVLQSFPYATITLDRFHMQQLATDPMQELRLKYKKEAQKEQNEKRKLFKAQLAEKYEKSPSARTRHTFLKGCLMATLCQNCLRAPAIL